MDSSPMAPMDLSGSIFPASLASPEPIFSWGPATNGMYCNNVKSEGAFSSPLNTPSNNSNNESCLSNLMQGIMQMQFYSKYFSAPLPTDSFSPNISNDPAVLGAGDLNQQGKCDFSTVTSTRRDQYLNHIAVSAAGAPVQITDALDLSLRQQEQPSISFTDASTLPMDRPSARWNTQAAHVAVSSSPGLRVGSFPTPIALATDKIDSSASEQQRPQQDVALPRFSAGLFTSEMSDDSSLDGLLPTSSTVSSTSDTLPLGEDQEDDVVCTTSAEPPSLTNFTLSSPRMPGGTLRPPLDQQKGVLMTSVQSSDQIPCSLNLESPKGVAAADSVVVESAVDDIVVPCVAMLDVDVKVSEIVTATLGKDRKWKHEGDDNWCGKKVKESPSSSPSGTACAAATAAFVPNLPLNVDPNNTDYLMRSNSTNMYHLQQQNHNLNLGAALDASKVPGTAKDTLMHENLASMTHAMLFGGGFPPVMIDTAAIESSRPKRRNVRISKDPQSVAARHRRERISDRIRVLQRLVPGGTKMDTASMLDEAIHYVKFLKMQVQTLESVSNAGYDPRMGFAAPFFRPSNLNYRPTPLDCSTMSQSVNGSVPEHGFYGPGTPFLGQPSFPDASREQFCH